LPEAHATASAMQIRVPKSGCVSELKVQLDLRPKSMLRTALWTLLNALFSSVHLPYAEDGEQEEHPEPTSARRLTAEDRRALVSQDAALSLSVLDHFLRTLPNLAVLPDLANDVDRARALQALLQLRPAVIWTKPTRLYL